MTTKNDVPKAKPAKKVCACCGKPATCRGCYENPNGPAEYACDDCCGHGNEDGWCEEL